MTDDRQDTPDGRLSEGGGVAPARANGAARPLQEDAPGLPTDPRVLEQLAAFRDRVQAGIGEVVLAMMHLPRYRNQTLADLMGLVVEPMIADRIAIARSAGEGKLEETAGIAIWASVSEEADARIREQIQARAFPVRLKAADWASGDICWLFDVIAPTQKAATAVLANFRQVVQDKPIRLHPLLGTLVDPAILETMRVRQAPENTA
jgi:cytolysin-activating lysine-acyltransferase